MSERVLVGIGSNVQPLKHIPRTLAALEAEFGPLTRSRAYRNPPVGIDGPDFINLVVGFDSHRDPFQVVAALKAIEGRPRAVDLDLLLFGRRIIDAGPVRVPRADITRHAFVLAPLAEIAPDLVHPQRGRTLARLWAEFDRTQVTLTPVELPPPSDP